ncbi:conserved hypothetical protein [Leishmania braziliensis MHOM/BR/75/M2904]|uniref:DUF1935 domain-containing protein n=2 Tax=Leishmania braziliensis TaxID=5660 RepID=E9AII0_LEIBR|nr:conserved hypothetical protein [Leishmania braziliensis MHOM/BR/75/M2904]KAI5686791.1 hypothetical protein MNV84_03447 [Leishmania braziliensis]CAJ2472061.1 unnamed protein product [Leishmania braziliensis]CAJ2472576.1 unnamed protein product [Leishmania braziliensis]CBZ14624.1 conserved hypothetical protein [Leishmania braziliensis MHOM/BR/75/M2904]SYZ65561.1 Domain_of_uncharacterised_function_(DUF1935) [Leishmania braziliensis MHOM/BR/75/M2904]
MGCEGSKNIGERLRKDSNTEHEAAEQPVSDLDDAPVTTVASPIAAIISASPASPPREVEENWEVCGALTSSLELCATSLPTENNATSESTLSAADTESSEELSKSKMLTRNYEQPSTVNELPVSASEKPRAIVDRQHELFTKLRQQENQDQHVMDKGSPYAGPGPAAEFPVEQIYRCFNTQNGLLFRLVNNKRHMWAFYNDTTMYVMRVSVTFGPESSVKALGNTRQIMLNEETGECRLVLDVAPGETQKFMRGEYNGFITCYAADPLDDISDFDAGTMLPQ